MRQLIYLLVFLSLALPISFGFSIRPAKNLSAEKLFTIIEELPTDAIVLVSMDWGPATSAENKPQTEVLLEHLVRRGIRFVLVSQDPLGERYMERLPRELFARLKSQGHSKEWQYGHDWVNLGFRPGGAIFMQAFAKSQNWSEYLKKDATGQTLSTLPLMNEVKNIQSIKLVAEFTGSNGMLPNFIRFFQTEAYRPAIVHGCTSISIPEAFTYLDSGQLIGLFEGLAGAAWYSYKLSTKIADRPADSALLINSGVGIAHLLVIALIVVGNLISLRGMIWKR